MKNKNQSKNKDGQQDNHHLSLAEKYRLYEASVQCPESDIAFLDQEYQRHYGRPPQSLREDFGGTGKLACLWAQHRPGNTAVAVDLDPAPMAYGMEHHFSQLTSEQKSRVRYVQGDVLNAHGENFDLIVAFNFSYFIFKQRRQLLAYFTQVRRNLADQGAFFLDIFGGIDAHAPSIEETEHEEHTYYWDCDKFNPITHECLYYIHFKKHQENRKYDQVFTYDWRFWTIPEIRDLLEEAGFSHVATYWEGTDEDGEGDGNFYLSDHEENCESWVTYLVAYK